MDVIFVNVRVTAARDSRPGFGVPDSGFAGSGSRFAVRGFAWHDWITKIAKITATKKTTNY
jgi:hypothetical protein